MHITTRRGRTVTPGAWHARALSRPLRRGCIAMSPVHMQR